MTYALANHSCREEKALTRLLSARKRSQLRHYTLSSTSGSFAIDIPGQPHVDRSEMSARAVISTSTTDRVGDVLIPIGCQIGNYAKNPVVMWAHGLEGIGQPIGTSQDKTGRLAVEISEKEVQATSWFSQKSLEAAQIFELIDEGIVRATSVRETPIKAHVERDPNAGELLIVEEWDLEEWSWCAVGVNPDAVAKALHRNRLGGQPITESIIKSLIAVAPTPKRLGVGFSKERIKVAEMAQIDDEVTDANDDDQPFAIGDDRPVSDTQPYGSTVVSAVHTSLASACQNIQEAMGPLENPTVKEGLQAILLALQEQMTALEGLHASSYPDQAALKSDGEDADQDAEAMKAFLASGQVASLQFLGLGARLNDLIGAPNLTATQRHMLSAVAKQMGKLVAQSKSQRSGSEAAKIVALRNSIRELNDLVKSFKR